VREREGERERVSEEERKRERKSEGERVHEREKNKKEIKYMKRDLYKSTESNTRYIATHNATDTDRTKSFLE